jgi:hypothetical protein
MRVGDHDGDASTRRAPATLRAMETEMPIWSSVEISRPE